MFEAIGMEVVHTRGCVGQDARWIVKTRGFVGLDVGGSVKTHGFVDPGVQVGGGQWALNPKRRRQILI